MRTPYKEAIKSKLKIQNNDILQNEAFGEHFCTELEYNLVSVNISVPM